MTTAVFSKVLLGSNVQNGRNMNYRLGRHDVKVQDQVRRVQGSDSIRNEMEAKDKKVLRCVFIQKNLKDYKKKNYERNAIV